jgi:nitroreductase
MDMRAPTGHPIQTLLADRWSPYAFLPEPLADADLLACLEAARWAPSSYNEQPWRFIVARRQDGELFTRALSCLVEANREWAQHASVLLLTVVSTTFARNGKPNGKAQHDQGQASALLSVEAAARGLAAHQMGGIFPDRVREEFDVPADHEVLTAIALGRPAAPNAGGGAARQRRPLAELLHGERWGEPPAFL